MPCVLVIRVADRNLPVVHRDYAENRKRWQPGDVVMVHRSLKNVGRKTLTTPNLKVVESDIPYAEALTLLEGVDDLYDIDDPRWSRRKKRLDLSALKTADRAKVLDATKQGDSLTRDAITPAVKTVETIRSEKGGF